MEQLTHNTANAVTAGIWRIPYQGGTAIRKRLSPRSSPDTPPHWRASADPTHFNYWRREAFIYEQEITARFAGTGLRLPRLFELQEDNDSGEVELILEDIRGVTGADLALKDYATVGRALGHAQGRYTAEDPLVWFAWLSSDFLEQYPNSKPYDSNLLYLDDVWKRPLVRENWAPGLRNGLQELYERRIELLNLNRAVPRTFCHLDFWPNNLFVTPSNEVIPVDWTFAGDGALGEDIANLIPDAVFDLLWPSTRLGELETTVYQSYLAGLQDAGWSGDERLVRLGMCASAVKYFWLGPMMLENASKSAHRAYGGVVEENPERPVSRARRSSPDALRLDGRSICVSRRAGLVVLGPASHSAKPRLGRSYNVR